MTKPTLLHICATAKPGGAETFFLRTMLALHKRVNLKVIVRENSWLSGELSRHQIQHYTLPFKRRFDFSTKRQIAKIIQAEEPAVVQAWMKRAAMFLPKTKVTTVGRLGGLYNLKYFKNCDWLVGNTPEICVFIKNGGWPEERVQYLPNFAPPPRAVTAEEALAVRAQHHIPQAASLLFMSGRLHKVKGVDIAIKALAQTQDTHLLLAGMGPEQEALTELAQAEGVAKRVHFAGWVSDLAPLAAAADIWLVASRAEPLGNTLLDAWWHQVPAVVTRTAGPLGLAEDEKTALFVDIGDYGQLAAAIQRLQRDKVLAAELTQAGLAEVQSRYSESALVPKYLKFYEEISGCAA